MSVRKDERQPLPIDPADLDVDPAVTAALGRPRSSDIYDRIVRARRMTPAQRRKAQRDRERNRVILDLPPDLDDTLEMLSQEERVSKSQLAAYLLLLGLSAFENINNFNWLKTPTRSMRFEFNVNLPEIPNVFYQDWISSGKAKDKEMNGTVNGSVYGVVKGYRKRFRICSYKAPQAASAEGMAMFVPLAEKSPSWGFLAIF